MFEHKQSGSVQRPVTVLTLLFGLLLGFAGGGSQLSIDPNKVRIGTAEISRTATAPRTGGRSSEDRSDSDDGFALLPPPPRIVTERVALHPLAPSTPVLATPISLDPEFPYQARAPPAA